MSGHQRGRCGADGMNTAIAISRHIGNDRLDLLHQVLISKGRSSKGSEGIASRARQCLLSNTKGYAHSRHRELPLEDRVRGRATTRLNYLRCNNRCWSNSRAPFLRIFRFRSVTPRLAPIRGPLPRHGQAGLGDSPRPRWPLDFPPLGHTDRLLQRPLRRAEKLQRRCLSDAPSSNHAARAIHVIKIISSGSWS